MTLEEENATLRRENAELHTLLAQALARIAELEKALDKPTRHTPSFVKPNKPTKPKRKPKRKPRAAHFNAARRYQDPTHIVHHSLDRCPDCSALLSSRSFDRRRQVIDLPPPTPIQITEHQVHKGWCGRCRRWRSPKLDLSTEVVGQARFGIRLMSLVSHLATTLRVPQRQIQQYLATLHQLDLSVGALSAMLSTVQACAKPHLKALKTALRRSAVVHVDETGWRENGKNGYIWSFSTPDPHPIRYYEYHKSRSGMVARRVLSGRFHGHLVSDFYSGYNWYAGKHQRCWVHLLRDMHALKEEWKGDELVVRWVKDVGRVYEEGMVFKRLGARASPAQRRAAYAGWVEEIRQIGLRFADAHAHPCQILAKRLLRHQDELMQFVLVDGLSADNNLAERSVRPLVIARKVSGGSRSPQGSATRMGLFSLFGTWAARGEDALEACRMMLIPQTALPQL